MSQPTPAFDAFLLVSFGGPERMEDVIPFLENVLRGRNVPRERMLEVAHHYEQFGGVSPINGQNRAILNALKDEFTRQQIDLPIYWGNRNWDPYLTGTMRQMKEDGVQHAIAFFTSAYSSYSGCRQYREDLYRAQKEVGEGAPQVSLLRKFYNHPGFIDPNIASVQTAIDRIPAELRSGIHIAFTAHSIPQAMARGARYERQLRETCRLVAGGLAETYPWELVYQSRSGSPTQPWLDPDIGDHLRSLHARGVTSVVIAPVGFISDHMEVMYDLDTEARAICDELGMHMERAATASIDPRFITMIGELVRERIGDGEKQALGTLGPSHDVCPINCCLPGVGFARPATAGRR